MLLRRRWVLVRFRLRGVCPRDARRLLPLAECVLRKRVQAGPAYRPVHQPFHPIRIELSTFLRFRSLIVQIAGPVRVVPSVRSPCSVISRLRCRPIFLHQFWKPLLIAVWPPWFVVACCRRRVGLPGLCRTHTIDPTWKIVVAFWPASYRLAHSLSVRSIWRRVNLPGLCPTMIDGPRQLVRSVPFAPVRVCSGHRHSRAVLPVPRGWRRPVLP